MSQHGEMDLHVRYFDEDFVPTRYISSAFLGRGTAEDLLKAFQDYSLMLTCQESLPAWHVWTISILESFSPFGEKGLTAGQQPPPVLGQANEL